MKSQAVLKGCPISPRKMRLVVNLIRRKDINEARRLLAFSTKHASKPVLETLNSAVSNFFLKHPESKFREEELMVDRIFVDQGVTAKRISPAPMGKALRIRKRSNRLTVVVSKK